MIYQNDLKWQSWDWADALPSRVRLNHDPHIPSMGLSLFRTQAPVGAPGPRIPQGFLTLALCSTIMSPSERSGGIMQVDSQPEGTVAMGCPQNPRSPVPAHTLVQLTAGGGQDHSLQHLCVKLVIGPGAGFIAILGARERVGREHRLPGQPNSCPFCPIPELPDPVPQPHPMPKTCSLSVM